MAEYPTVWHGADTAVRCLLPCCLSVVLIVCTSTGFFSQWLNVKFWNQYRVLLVFGRVFEYSKDGDFLGGCSMRILTTAEAYFSGICNLPVITGHAVLYIPVIMKFKCFKWVGSDGYPFGSELSYFRWRWQLLTTTYNRFLQVFRLLREDVLLPEVELWKVLKQYEGIRA